MLKAAGLLTVWTGSLALLQAEPSTELVSLLADAGSFAALLVSVALGWISPGWVLKDERARNAKLSEQLDSFVAAFNGLAEAQKAAEEKEREREQRERIMQEVRREREGTRGSPRETQLGGDSDVV